VTIGPAAAKLAHQSRDCVHQPLEIAAALVLALAVAGCGYQLLAAARMRILMRRDVAATGTATTPPGVTVLKPLYGEEPGLEAALASFLAQDYAGAVQVVLGLQDPADPARQIAERIIAAHPGRDVRLVIEPRRHGCNGKISNLVNMAAHAKYERLVLSDSDIAAPPDYLAQVVRGLDAPGVGVVTCPYYGLQRTGIWSRLGAMGLSYQFLPSVAVGVTFGLAQPCMGSTIALTRETLGRIGGFDAFVDQLADDYEIGAAVRATGLRSVVAPVLVAHGCAERSLAELVAHELRWARTIRGVDPAGFAGSGLTHVVPLALIGVALTGGAPAGWAVLGMAIAARLWLMREVDMFAPRVPRAWRLLAARDILSFAVFLASFFVRVVDWRGARFRVDSQGGMSGIKV
jgi:ceramide glucosyltransferase